MRGIPANPVDGVSYANVLEGVPVVLEYDDQTGGYRLVVTTENEDVIRAPINVSGSTVGQYVLISATGSSNNKIKILSALLTSSSNNSAQLLSGFSGTVIVGPTRLPADGDGFILPPPASGDFHWVETESGDDLVVELLLGGAQVGGFINYYNEP
ncbi:MAG: hypothetical protein ACXAB4_00710 [Candidatus Hodarchaeales archaeon]|jgi:hypothetical protein